MQTISSDEILITVKEGLDATTEKINKNWLMQAGFVLLGVSYAVNESVGKSVASYFEIPSEIVKFFIPIVLTYLFAIYGHLKMRYFIQRLKLDQLILEMDLSDRTTEHSEIRNLLCPMSGFEPFYRIVDENGIYKRYMSLWILTFLVIASYSANHAVVTVFVWQFYGPASPLLTVGFIAVHVCLYASFINAVPKNVKNLRTLTLCGPILALPATVLLALSVNRF